MKTSFLSFSLLSVVFLAGCAAPLSPEPEPPMPVGMPHDRMDHGASMTMGDMMDMLDGKTGDAFDRAFIEGMIPHHQGAIDMANAALEHAGREEIRQMARDIIDSQQAEIDMMRRWQREWGHRE